jgi:hypothetical protein
MLAKWLSRKARDALNARCAWRNASEGFKMCLNLHLSPQDTAEETFTGQAEVPDHSPLVDDALVKKFEEMGFAVGPRRISRILSKCNGDVDSAAAFLAHKAAHRAQKHCHAPSS